MRAREVPVLQHECNIAFESLMKSGFFERQAEQSSACLSLWGGILTEASKGVAQLRRGNRGPRHAYTTASSAAALGHLGAADKRGSGAKTARNRCTECLRRAVSMISRRALDWRCRKPIGAPPGCARSRRHALPALLRSLAGCPAWSESAASRARFSDHSRLPGCGGGRGSRSGEKVRATGSLMWRTMQIAVGSRDWPRSTPTTSRGFDDPPTSFRYCYFFAS